jgi:hypothetical protein
VAFATLPSASAFPTALHEQDIVDPNSNSPNADADASWLRRQIRVEWIWRREGLKVTQKQPKRGRLWLHDGSCIRLRPEHRNHVWSTTPWRTAPMQRECPNIFIAVRDSGARQMSPDRQYRLAILYAQAAAKGGAAMRMMLKIIIPTEAGNRTIKDGTLPKVLEGAMNRLKAEAAYFVAEDGLRTAMIFFDMRDSADIPGVVEPLFMGIDAEVELLPVMNADDMRRGLKAAMEAM